MDRKTFLFSAPASADAPLLMINNSSVIQTGGNSHCTATDPH